MLNKILTLERPLAVLDFETTGLDAEQDRVVQVCIKMHYPDRDVVEWVTLINPEMPIPPFVSTKHKIFDDDVKDKAPFKHYAADLAKKLLQADIGGYNVSFDMKFLRAEMKRAGVDFPWDNYILDPITIYKMKKGHTLTNCYLEYGGENGEPLPADTSVDDAHDAGFDVYMTEVALRGQLLRHDNLPRTVKELSAFCFPKAENAVDSTGKFIWVNDKICVSFGKYKGKTLEEAVTSNRGYFKWFVGADFPEDAKIIVNGALDGIFPTKEKEPF